MTALRTRAAERISGSRPGFSLEIKTPDHFPRRKAPSRKNSSTYFHVLAFLALTEAPAQTTDLKFDHITVEQGLSQDIVRIILQDRKGYRTTGSLEDSRGDLWVGTDAGLNMYDRDRGAFVRVLHDSSDKTSISSNLITALSEDTEGNLWIGMLNGAKLSAAGCTTTRL